MNTYAIYYLRFLFLINLPSCDYSAFALSIWCMECRFMCVCVCGGGGVCGNEGVEIHLQGTVFTVIH